MKLATFFEKFDQFADAPNAVAKMRELVLTLAVQGRLTAGSEVVGWPTVAMRDICLQITDGEHATPHRTSHGVPLATAKNVRDGFLDLTNTDYVAKATAEKCWRRCKPRDQDVLMVCVGATTGRVCLVQNPADIVLVRSVALIRPNTEHIAPSFLNLFLRSPGGQRQIWANVKQSAQPCLYLGKIAAFEVSLPPIAEQKRIVAKVDELMALCDRLEAQQQERATRHAALARASLARFADAPTPANLNVLFHKSYTIDPAELRKSILALAVRGKLAAQHPDDQTADELLWELEGDRHRFAQTHNFRSPAANLIDGTSVPFEIPATWKWCRLSTIFNAVTDGDHLPPPKSDDGIAFLTIGNITTGKLDFQGCRFVPDSYYRDLAEYRQPVRGDILYTVVGATYGRPALVETDRPFCVQRHIAILKPPRKIEAGYLMAALRSTMTYEQATASTTGTAQPTIPLGALRNFVIPVPPLAEQRRIVAKVDQLMALVDKLETQLAASRATAQNLLDAIVAELTAAGSPPPSPPTKKPARRPQTVG